MHPENFFKDEGLLAFISDASIDFTPANFDSPLTNDQHTYILKTYGHDISQVFWRKQVHGDDVLEALDDIALIKNCPDADAYITDKKNLPIAIRTADCVPVFIFDPVHHAIGLAHAGWRGTYKKIAAKTVRKMQEKYASQPSSLKILLAPSIRQCCYEVGAEFRDYFPSHVNDRAGRLYADVTGANYDQLLQEGVRQENIFDSCVCTCCNMNYFSYRRDGAETGRMMSLMMMLQR